MSAVALAAPPRSRSYVSRRAYQEEMRELLRGDALRMADVSDVRDVMRRAANRNGFGMRPFESAKLFDKGRDAFANKVIGWTADTQKAMLLDLSAAGTYNKLITGVTNASPAVYTSASHGASNGDLILVGGILGNLCANQLGYAASVATNTFQLTTTGKEAANVNGNAAWTSGGYMINLTQAQYVAGILGNRVGTDQTIAGTSSSKGIVTGTSPLTWTTVPAGNAAQMVVLYDAAGGADATNRLIGLNDGKVQVVLDKAAIATDTTLIVESLKAQLWDGAIGAAPVIYWSDGHTSTLNAAAAQGDRTLTVTSQAVGGVAIGSTAEVTTFGSGFPVTPSGGSISFTIGSILIVGPGLFQL